MEALAAQQAAPAGPVGAAAAAAGGGHADEAADAAAAPPLQPLSLPPGGHATPEWCLVLEQALLRATRHPAGAAATAQVLTQQLLHQLLKHVTNLLHDLPALLELRPSAAQQRVTVVGDTHGQYHDVCRLFDLFGHPSSDRVYIFNGDYVDRGAWGVETLALLLAWKWALPAHVHLLRGNHETSFATLHYGFRAELLGKYSAAGGQGLYAGCQRLFASLPLAALVEGNTLILHGGLFRVPPLAAKRDKGKGQPKQQRRTLLDVDGSALRLGTLQDLRSASKGGVDPDPERNLNQLTASDVLWSDPSPNSGHRPNDLRGVGTVFGPDVTEQFLSQNGLRLVIRSHEGPDARDKRLEGEVMPPIDSGYSVDHQGPSGRLVTLFSAPDYPQFMAEGEERYHNRGAVLHLSAPDWATPAVESFEAVLPRPKALPYYDTALGALEEDAEQPTTASAAAAAAGGTPAVAGAAEVCAAGAHSWDGGGSLPGSPPATQGTPKRSRQTLTPG